MKKIIIFFTVIITVSIFPLAFSQENITIATYYPSPVGVYENIRFFPVGGAHPACNVNNEGLVYYDNNSNLLMVCRQTATSPDVYSYQSASSLWVQQGETGPNGADPIALHPYDHNLKIGIGDVNVGWNRQNRFAVTDNTSTNGLGEQIALMEILNPRRGNSGAWSGGGDSVTALQLTPGGASWQVRADEFNSAAAQDSAAAGAFMIHQTINGNPATRLVIRNNGNVGLGENNPQERLHVANNARVNGNLMVNGNARVDGRIYGRLDCRTVEVSGGASPTWVSVASCANDEWVLTGGGKCAVPEHGTKGFIHESHPYGNGWVVDCFKGDSSGDCTSTAYAVCCKAR